MTISTNIHQYIEQQNIIQLVDYDEIVTPENSPHHNLLYNDMCADSEQGNKGLSEILVEMRHIETIGQVGLQTVQSCRQVK